MRPGESTRSLKGATRRLMTCESTVEVTSTLVSTSTSPLSVSTMREAVRRPTSASARSAIFSTPASAIFSARRALMTLPAATMGSRWRGGFTSSATLAPT